MGFRKIYSKKVEYDGYKFDSETEYLYYIELKEREKKGEVCSIIVHPSYVLLERFENNNGHQHKELTYAPDFVYFDRVLNKTRYVDVKGFETDEFKIRRKLFDWYLINHKEKNSFLEVLKYSKTTGFVEIADYKKVMKSKKQKIIEEKNYYKSIVEKEEKYRIKKAKDLARLKELKSIDKPTKAQRERIKVLEERYSND